MPKDTDRTAIPAFEGLTPDTVGIAFKGSVEGRPPRLPVGREGSAHAFIVWGVVVGVNHEHKGSKEDRRYVRGQKVEIERVLPVDLVEAERLYNEAIEAWAALYPDQGSMDEALVTGDDGDG